MSEVAAAIGTGDRSLIARLRDRVPSAIAIEIALILVLLVIGAALSEQFRTLDNLANIYEQASVLLLVSLGQTVVILTGGIDLSFEGNIALTGSILSGQVHGASLRHAPRPIGGMPDVVLTVAYGRILRIRVRSALCLD